MENRMPLLVVVVSKLFDGWEVAAEANGSEHTFPCLQYRRVGHDARSMVGGASLDA
jgi:hypothetical protein